MSARSPDALAGLDDVGYVVVPDVLPPEVCASLHVAFETADVQEAGTQHVRIDDDTPRVDAWRALAAHPIVASVAARVLARPYRVRDAHGRNPLRGYGQQGLHADWKPRAPGSAWFVVTLLWMLDRFTRENRATRVVPRSHTWIAPLPKRLAQPLAHHPDEVVVTGEAGSVLVFNGHLLHSGRKNRLCQPRPAKRDPRLA